MGLVDLFIFITLGYLNVDQARYYNIRKLS